MVKQPHFNWHYKRDIISKYSAAIWGKWNPCWLGTVSSLWDLSVLLQLWQSRFWQILLRDGVNWTLRHLDSGLVQTQSKQGCVWACEVRHVPGGRGTGTMGDHGNSTVFIKEKKTLIQWGFKVVITFRAGWKMMSCVAKLLKAFIPAKMSLRAYPDQCTSQEGTDPHRLAEHELSKSQTHR